MNLKLSNPKDKKENAQKAIFLHDYSITSWKNDFMLHHRRTNLYNSVTNLESWLSTDSVRKEYEGYLVFANASIYRAKILREDHSANSPEFDKREPKTEILYSGQIGIHKLGKIEDTSIVGREFMGNGEIWTALEAPACGIHDSLNELIFGKSRRLSDSIKRIESIIRGYELQDEEKSEARSQANYNSFLRGKHSRDR